MGTMNDEWSEDFFPRIILPPPSDMRIRLIWLIIIEFIIETIIKYIKTKDYSDIEYHYECETLKQIKFNKSKKNSICIFSRTSQQQPKFHHSRVANRPGYSAEIGLWPRPSVCRQRFPGFRSRFEIDPKAVPKEHGGEPRGSIGKTINYSKYSIGAQRDSRTWIGLALSPTRTVVPIGCHGTKIQSLGRRGREWTSWRTIRIARTKLRSGRIACSTAIYTAA